MAVRPGSATWRREDGTHLALDAADAASWRRRPCASPVRPGQRQRRAVRRSRRCPPSPPRPCRPPVSAQTTRRAGQNRACSRWSAAGPSAATRTDSGEHGRRSPAPPSGQAGSASALSSGRPNKAGLRSLRRRVSLSAKRRLTTSTRSPRLSLKPIALRARAGDPRPIRPAERSCHAIVAPSAAFAPRPGPPARPG